MTSTWIVPVQGQAPSIKRPMLHAFPENSWVALCGKTRKDVEEDGAPSAERCPTCLHEAGRKAHFTR